MAFTPPFLVSRSVTASSGATLEIRAPSTTQVVAEHPRSNRSDVQTAVGLAADSVTEWNATPIAAREAIFFGAAGRLEQREAEAVRVIAGEMGKPVTEALGEVRRAQQILRYFGGELRRSVGSTYRSDSPSTFLYTWRDPLGVVGLITPWNFPIAIPAWKIAPALAYGNAAVIKPASAAPGATVLLAECLLDAGLPQGALRVLIGNGAEVGEALIGDTRVNAISYTGSNTVGRGVRQSCAELGKRSQVELGGQNPAIVLADANLDLAAAAVVLGAYGNAGQKCTSTRRVIVERPVVDEFTDAVLSRARALRMGDPLESNTELGPVIDSTAVEAYENGLARGVDEGGRQLAGRVFDDRAGFYVAPAVVTNVEPGTFLAREEVFAPLLAVMPVENYDQAIELANDVRFGLSAAIFTRSIDRSREFVSDIRAGVVHVNSQTAGAEVHVPFGGMKESGSGFREQGRAAREFFTETKTVYHDPGA